MKRQSIEKPNWFQQKIEATALGKEVRKTLKELGLSTVCEEAKCPNRNSCYGDGHATFLIMGNNCSRNCRFCAVDKKTTEPLDPNEPIKVARACKAMNLSYVVITSVTRDDLPDGGSAHFAETIRRTKELSPDILIEVLTSDFQGDEKALDRVMAEKPVVFNHNVETIERLYDEVRPMADYRQSLDVLKYVADNYDVPVKTGFMVGLGETPEEVRELLEDLRKAGANLVTIGQYLQPSSAHYPVQQYITPEQFSIYGEQALAIGFAGVRSGPLVRSSYQADKLYLSLAELNPRRKDNP